ncbi:hypothetical protein [Pseudoalteromonas sp. BZA4]|uniref:hypothetical protein n=1 Tax=Pseudoalteromonas sp. BZA4 TaxID=3136669 RepID=UPI0032C42653
MGWVERSDAQHIEAVSSQPSAVRRAKQVSRLPVAAALCRDPLMGSKVRDKARCNESNYSPTFNLIDLTP